MLVLTVREGDVIEIGDNVRIMVRHVKKGILKASIDAPPDIAVRRLSAADPLYSDTDHADEDERVPEPAVFVTTRRRRPGTRRD